MASPRSILVLAWLVAACSSGGGSVPEGEHATAAHGAPWVTVGNDHRDFASAVVTLCSERFPEAISLSLLVSDESCPELTSQGPAGTRVSRGRVCEELAFEVSGWEPGVAIVLPARGAAVRYSRHTPPAVHLDAAGAAGEPGEITIQELVELDDGAYRLSFSLSLGDELEARGTVVAEPTYCISA